MRAAFPTFSVDIRREEIPTHSMFPSKVPDPSWRHVDKAGHGHFWQGGELPTLNWVVTGSEWVGDDFDGEEIETGEYQCRLCAEVVDPEMKVTYAQVPIPGLITIEININGEIFFVTEEQYAMSVEAWAESLRGLR